MSINRQNKYNLNGYVNLGKVIIIRNNFFIQSRVVLR